MLDSRVEKVLIIFSWYVLLLTFRFVLPISEPPSNIDKYVVITLSIVATILISHIYVYFKNKHILKKINFLLETNQLEKAIKYINNYSKRQKNCISVHMYKLYVLAMSGRIIEFEKTISKFEGSNKYRKLLKSDFVLGLTYIINYFKTCTCAETLLAQQYWNDIVYALSEKDHEKGIPILLSMYSSATFDMIKSVLSFKLYLTYLEIGDIEKSEKYYNESMKYAPSLEVLHYIEKSKKDRIE